MSQPTDAEPTDVLPYCQFDAVPDAHPAVQDLSDRLTAVWEDSKDGLQAQANLRETVRSRFEAGDISIIPAYVSAVGSIQTPTDTWEEATQEYLQDPAGNLENYLEKTQDSDSKVAGIQRVLSSAVLRDATTALRDGKTVKAREVLRGDHHDIETYLGTTKASFVTWLLGYDTPCLDTNVHSALAPTWEVAFGRTEFVEDRSGTGQVKPRNPAGKEYLNERLSPVHPVAWYDAHVKVARRTVAEATDIPPEHIAQVAFTAGQGKTKAHTHAEVFAGIAKTA